MNYKGIAALMILSIMRLSAQSDQELALATVNKNEIEAHIYFLTDDLLKGRETGSEGLSIAASYLANAFRGYGVKPNPQNGTYYQTVPLIKKMPPAKIRLSLNNTEYRELATIESISVLYSGDAVYVGFGLEQDYSGKEVAGKFVVCKGGSEAGNTVRDAWRMRMQKQALAKAKGALGVIELLKAEDEIWGFIEHDFNSTQFSIPKDGTTPDPPGFNYHWLLDADESLAALFEGKGVFPMQFESDGQSLGSITSQNVIGLVEGSDPELKKEFIIYSAHYDHVGIGKPDETGDSIYNGARDNAVGTTTVLSMAENMAKYPTKRSALFILFTGEEKGLLGSEYYVEHPVLPLKQMVYCFNSDNGGYNNTELATIIGLTRTTAEKDIVAAAAAFSLKAIEDPAPEQGLFDRSDNVHFAKKGIPAPTFSLGFESFDGDVTKYYHQPGDEADTLDYDYLEQFFRAYVLAGRLLGNNPETPFWVPGDSYEAAGKALYME